MAAKYFGDTALVRPQSDGTFKVGFSATSEGASHIISLAYNGSTLAKSGNQYTVSIPKADSDTVVPISMTIKEMEPSTSELVDWIRALVAGGVAVASRRRSKRQ